MDDKAGQPCRRCIMCDRRFPYSPGWRDNPRCYACRAPDQAMMHGPLTEAVTAECDADPYTLAERVWRVVESWGRGERECT